VNSDGCRRQEGRRPRRSFRDDPECLRAADSKEPLKEHAHKKNLVGGAAPHDVADLRSQVAELRADKQALQSQVGYCEAELAR